LPLSGGTDPQSYTVTSTNPSIPVTVAQGQFLTLNITHASSGANDPGFTGSMTFQLFQDLTPNTVSMITQLVNQGFYNGKNFFRIANNFPGATDYIIQGGSSTNDATGTITQPGFPFADEFNTQLAFTGSGQLAMANSGPNTNGSQFFITTGSPRFLDFKHTIWGQIVSGQQILSQITRVAIGGSDGTTPLSPVTITTATLSNTNPNGVLHVSAVQSSADQQSTVTVTATDLVDHSTTSRTFQVTVTPDTVNGAPNIPRPFIQQPIPNQVVGVVPNSNPIQGQTSIFQVHGVDANPNDQLQYVVAGGATSTGFTPLQNATATVDNNGVVTVKPNAGFTGVINMVIGVRDQTDRSGTGDINNIANWDYAPATLTVQNTAPVPTTPIAVPGTANVPAGVPTTVQLQANSANPQGNPTLTYALVSQPAHGTISNFNAQNGTLTYSPAPGYLGPDQFSFNVAAAFPGGPTLTSRPAVETVSVGGGGTGAVRLIGSVLVVTPLPKSASNTQPNGINVTQNASGNVLVTVNGLTDAIQPLASNLDRVVVYGSKASDDITIDPSLTVPVTLDGGQGGTNVLQAGSQPALEHGWFGTNTLIGSPQDDMLIGRTGHVRFVKSGGTDLMFTGQPRRLATLHRQGIPRQGTFYRFVGNRLVQVSPTESWTTPTSSSSSTTGGSTSGTGTSGSTGTGHTHKKR
jgi:cyclophilin family peptidyl-prolyl cis-trans isomerase